jgi:hypothetical protein
MHMKLIATLAICSVAWPASAQTYNDQSICTAIGRPGLYYVPTRPDLKITPVGAGSLVYDSGAKFVLITAPSNPSRSPDYEGVWHIRTQTIARQSNRANKAYVYRAPVRTRCSDGVLPDFSPGDRLVNLNIYLDHHLSDPRNPRPKAYELSRRFHMPIKDVADGSCVMTDNEREFNVAGTYGFTDIDRGDGSFEVATSLTQRAYAAKTIYQGLSSELAYRESPNGACVSFSVPIPTGPVPRSGWFSNAYDDALQAASSWKPTSTLLVVKRLEGRRVIHVKSSTINWASP